MCLKHKFIVSDDAFLKIMKTIVLAHNYSFQEFIISFSLREEFIISLLASKTTLQNEIKNIFTKKIC